MLLSKLCLTKTRTIAKHACDKNLVWVNEKPAKASQEIKSGDYIRFDLYGFKHQIQLIEIPKGNVAKKDCADYYTLLSKTALE
jgi:ribosomal 50S subunit-recycling heat shock protein